MSDNIVRTVYGATLQTSQLFDNPLTLPTHSTLNEKLGIYPELSKTLASVPVLNVACIGNKGHKIFVGEDGFSAPDTVSHEPTDAGLFGQLPFVLRAPSDDLTADERLRYRLRRLESHGGNQYVAYYGRVLDTSGAVVATSLKTVVDGETKSVEFVPTLENLNPTPNLLESTGTNVTTTQYVAATCKVPFTMDATDIEEFHNVINIIYGDLRYAMISEIALCTSLDQTVSGDFNGVTASYTEAIGVQVMTHISEIYTMRSLNNKINIIFDVGAVEPLNVAVS